MNDAEHLSRLLTNLPPLVFHDFLDKTFNLTLTTPDKKQGLREQRAAMAAELSGLPVASRRKLEDVAERIMMLCDGPGKDAVEVLSRSIVGVKRKAEFDACRSQYERALWLHSNALPLFDDAINARQADMFRQSLTCYSGFVAPKKLKVLDDEAAQQAFRDAVARHFFCSVDKVAVQIFKRLRPDSLTGDEVALYQISVHHNRPPEMVDTVKDSQLVSSQVVRATSTHITYEPAEGHLEVLSKDTAGRATLARIAADTLLQSPISGETIPLKQYDFQSLAVPRDFDIGDEPVAHVKVVELGFSTANLRSLVVRISAKDEDDIHAAARGLVGPGFDFRHHHLTYAQILIRAKKMPRERARTIRVVLRHENKCNIKTKREADRALCDRLLTRWNLVKEIGVDPAPSVDPGTA